MRIGHVSAHTILLLLEAAEHYGVDRQVLLAQQGIAPQRLDDPETRIGLTALMKLGYTAIAHSREPALGLQMGRITRVSHLGMPGMLAMTANTLGEAMERLTGYESLTGRCHRGSQKLVMTGDKACVRFFSIAPYNMYNLFVVDAILGGWYTLIEWLTGKTDLVQEMHFEFPAPEYVNRYQDMFSCPVLFGQPENQVVLKASDLSLPVLYACRPLHQTLLSTAQALMIKQTHAETFENRVQQILGPLLHGHTPTIEETAQKLGIPDWTLRRKLKEEGTSFQTLLDDMRRDLAIGYMKDTTLSFGEIAYILGFSTPGAFQRAFKRWTGMTPGDYRKQVR